MKKPTTISKESVSEYREFVQLRLRKRVLEAIEVVLEEEVNQALGCGSYERAEDRRGYRNGAETRRVTTSVGTRELRVPRARVRDEETGETMPWCTTPIEADSSLGPNSHHPIISLSGIPSAVMVLRILHPILASTLCAANPLARIAEPTIAL